jgi:hypothetical protein
MEKPTNTLLNLRLLGLVLCGLLLSGCSQEPPLLLIRNGELVEKTQTLNNPSNQPTTFRHIS